MRKTKLACVALVAAGLTGILAAVASAATPQNTSPPTISGTPKVGSTLTANEGTWANAPGAPARRHRAGSWARDGSASIAGEVRTAYPTTSISGRSTMVKGTAGAAACPVSPEGAGCSGAGPVPAYAGPAA